MLVLSRLMDETIEIQDPDGTVLAEVTIVDIRGEKVRLGVNAPKHYPVRRKEIAQAIRAEAARQRQKEGVAV